MKTESTMSQELKKYAFPKPIGWYISAVIFAGLMIAFIICAIIGNDVNPIGAVIFGAGIAVSVLFIVLYFKKMQKIMNDTNICNQWDKDFLKAVAMRKGKVKFGDEWIFIKKRKPFRYSEIAQIYQYVHKTNFVEDKRLLKYVDTNGKERILCNLELRDKSKDEMVQIMALIHSKNPSVKIGYR